MKLKIMSPSKDTHSGEEEQVIKKEEIEQLEDTQMSNSPEEEENSQNHEDSPIPESQPVVLSGKRKRKPKEQIDDFTPLIQRKRRKKKASNSKTKDGTPQSEDTATPGGSSSRAQLKSPTVIRAEEFQLNLDKNQPSVLKLLVRSHVASCVWMGLPVPFCKLHLPNEDSAVILVNESDQEFETKYIAHKTGLSAGWRKFVSENKLLAGDVLIFQLIEPCRFKVYIIRENDIPEVDGALSLLVLDSKTKQSDTASKQIETTPEGTKDSRGKKKKQPKSLPLTELQKEGPSEPSGNASNEVASDVQESSKSLKGVKNFEEFHVEVNGECIDSEIPDPIRRKYYDLCCGKNASLHERILPGLYSKLAAGMIFEVVNIADALKGCTLATPRTEFEVWEKSLRSFELLGLTVGFLRARLDRLRKLSFENEDASETKRYLDAKKEKSRAEEEIRNLEAKLAELKELKGKYDKVVEKSELIADGFERMFRDEVNAAW